MNRRNTLSAVIILTYSSASFAQHPTEHRPMEQLPSSPVVAAISDNASSAWTLESLQSIAMTHNPTLRQARAQVDAAQGAAEQARLPPNPQAGYVAEQIGVNGTAGELQGGYLSQEIVRGNKLALSQNKYLQRANIAATNLRAQEQRVLNDLQIGFYRVIAMQRKIINAEQAFEMAKDNAATRKEMLNMGQLGQAEVIKADVEVRRAAILLKDATNDFEQATRELTALIGCPNIVLDRLEGQLEFSSEPMQWETALSQLLATSPEIVSAMQKIRHDEMVVRRELVEPTPNLTVQLTSGYNSETQQATAGVNAGMPIPIFNRNQGTVRQARADLTRSHAELERLQLQLQSELSKYFRDYSTAWQHVQEYEQTILPSSRHAVEILVESYRQRRTEWSDVLDAKQLVLTLESEQIQNLLDLRIADITIRGNLLMGGLTEPEAPLSGGHIDANNQPR